MWGYLKLFAIEFIYEDISNVAKKKNVVHFFYRQSQCQSVNSISWDSTMLRSHSAVSTSCQWARADGMSMLFRSFHWDVLTLERVSQRLTWLVSRPEPMAWACYPDRSFEMLQFCDEYLSGQHDLSVGYSRWHEQAVLIISLTFGRVSHWSVCLTQYVRADGMSVLFWASPSRRPHLRTSFSLVGVSCLGYQSRWYERAVLTIPLR